MTITQVSHQHTQLHILNENMHIEILSAMHTYSITNLTTKIYLQSRTNTQQLLQQELQNPYWNLHDPITTKSYQISKDMDIETMPHTMYFTGNSDTVTKINQIPYQTIQYYENGYVYRKVDE